MGKSKAKKYKTKTTNPTGLPSVKELEIGLGEVLIPESIDADTIDSILEKLQSRRAEDKECAAVIIANLSSIPKFIGSLIDNKIIRVAAPLLLDKNLAVRHAIAGCLRNVAICGDYQVSESMVEQDIMTSLVALLEQYRDPWTPVETTTNKIDSKLEIFLEACNLLWSLCENCDLAVSIFNKQNIISILLPCLNVDIYGLQVPLAIVQCLHTIGENNPDLNDILRQPIVEEQLKALMTLPTTEPEQVLLRTLVAGVKLNIYSGKIDNCMADVTTPILDVVSSTFNESTNTIAELLSKQIQSHKNEKSDKYSDGKDLEDKFSAVRKTKDKLIHLLSAKQCALEMLGQMFEDVDIEGDDDWENLSSDSSEAIQDMNDMDVDEATVCATDIGLGVPSELFRSVVNGNLLEKVMEQIIVPTDDTLNVLNAQAETKDCVKKIDTVQCTSLLCLNNVLQKLDAKDLGGPKKLFELWLNLADLLFKKTDLNKTDLVEAVTRSMSAVLRKLAETNCTAQFSCMTESDLELLVNICNQTLDPGIKVHIIRVSGTIGTILGSKETVINPNLVKIIGSFLLEICSKSTDMWVTAEALDVIFDVFAEDHVDGIAQEISLVEKLTHILPGLKGRIKQQRKSFGDHLPVIMTAKENLLRFIKYKKDLHKK